MRPRTTILLAAALVFAIGSFFPYGHEILYPLTLFTTWVHEMGHGLTALVLGGDFKRLSIAADGSGYAQFDGVTGTRDALVALGGLLAPPIAGAVILASVHGPRRARAALAILAGAIVLSLVLWIRSTTGYIAMPILAALLAFAAWTPWLGHGRQDRVVATQILGVMLALDTAGRMIIYVFMKEVRVGRETHASDIAQVADNLGGHYILWGLLVTVFALGLLGGALWWAFSRPALTEPPGSPPS